VVADASLSFRAPARFDDELELRAQIAKLGSSSLSTEIDVVRDQQLLVSGTLRHVCVSALSAADSIPSSTPWPDPIRRALVGFAR
jgi:acyl-CoA thioester hydrolase